MNIHVHVHINFYVHGIIMFTFRSEVAEVAHDIQLQVSRYVSSELCLVNSYDTWHGAVFCNTHGTLCVYI